MFLKSRTVEAGLFLFGFQRKYKLMLIGSIKGESGTIHSEGVGQQTKIMKQFLVRSKIFNIVP